MHLMQNIIFFYKTVAINYCLIGNVSTFLLIKLFKNNKHRLQKKILYQRGFINIKHAAKNNELAYTYKNINELVRKYKNL